MMSKLPVLLALLTATNVGFGKTANPLDQGTKTAIVETIGKLLVDKYIDLEVAEKIRNHLTSKLEAGDYKRVDDPVAFARFLTNDLFESSQDYHFFIEFNPERADLIKAKRSRSKPEADQAEEKLRADSRWQNFGFQKLERLRGNVGYLDLRSFSNPEHGGETAVAAMNFLANLDAVIIDLRNNHGGSPAMVQLICSYFVKGTQEGRTLLNSFERRYNNTLEQYWTLSYLPGNRMYDTELYVLVSPQTGSGAEEFAYNMKNLKRATLVGESTRGAAHPVDEVIIQDSYVMHLPTGRPINPISGTNWEGTGVEPDVAVPANQAFDTAYTMALGKLLEQVEEAHRFEINWAIDDINIGLHPVTVDERILKKYAGNYGERNVRFEGGDLLYQRTGPLYKLIPITETLFAVEGLDDFRIRFVTDEEGNVTELVGLLSNGIQDPSKRM